MRSRHLGQRRLRELHSREFASKHSSRKRRCSDRHDMHRRRFHEVGQGHRQTGRGRSAGRYIPGRHLDARPIDDHQEHRRRSRRSDRSASHRARGLAGGVGRGRATGRPGDRLRRQLRGSQRLLSEESMDRRAADRSPHDSEDRRFPALYRPRSRGGARSTAPQPGRSYDMERRSERRDGGMPP